MHQHTPSILPARAGIVPAAGIRRRIAVVAAALAIAAAPALVAGTAAHADASFAVTSPGQGETGVQQTFPNVVPFTGIGLSAGNHIDVQYVTGDGSLHTAIYGGENRQADGSWTTNANFDLLGTGVTTVVSTVYELDATNTVVQQRPLTFTLAFAPHPADPFTVTSPRTLDVVPTTTPVFTGTGTVGSTVVITYGARSLQTAEAGVGTVGLDGSFSIPTDFSRIEPGETETRAIVTEYTPQGEPQPGVASIAIAFSFAETPAPRLPLTVSIDPTSLDVSTATSTGVAVAATGFSPNERVFVTVTDAAGTTVEPAGTRPADIFADDEDGSVSDSIVLPTGTVAGTYTITVTGERSTYTASNTLYVVADAVAPVPSPSATPGTTPGTQPVRPAGTGANGALANTGADAGAAFGIAGLAGMLVLAGAGTLIAYRRRARA